MEEIITESNRVTLRALIADWDYYHNIPDWQRGIVWEKPKQRAYMRALLNRNYTHPIVFFPEGGKRFILDGQQRLHAIDQYIHNRLGLYNNNSGRFFKDLPTVLQNQLLDYALTFDVLHGRSLDELIETYIGIQNLKAQKPAEKQYAYSTTTEVGKFAKKIATENPFFSNIYVNDIHKGDYSMALYPIAMERLGGLAGMDTPTITTLVKGVSHDIKFSQSIQNRVEDNLLYGAMLYSGISTKSRSAIIPIYQSIVFLRLCGYDLDHSESGALTPWFTSSVLDDLKSVAFRDGILHNIYRRSCQETFWLNNLRAMASSPGLVARENSVRQINRLYSWFYRNGKCMYCGDSISLSHFDEHAFSSGDMCSIPRHERVLSV